MGYRKSGYSRCLPIALLGYERGFCGTRLHQHRGIGVDGYLCSSGPLQQISTSILPKKERRSGGNLLRSPSTTKSKKRDKEKGGYSGRWLRGAQCRDWWVRLLDLFEFLGVLMIRLTVDDLVNFSSSPQEMVDKISAETTQTRSECGRIALAYQPSFLACSACWKFQVALLLVSIAEVLGLSESSVTHFSFPFLAACANL